MNKWSQWIFKGIENSFEVIHFSWKLILLVDYFLSFPFHSLSILWTFWIATKWKEIGPRKTMKMMMMMMIHLSLERWLYQATTGTVGISGIVQCQRNEKGRMKFRENSNLENCGKNLVLSPSLFFFTFFLPCCWYTLKKKDLKVCYLDWDFLYIFLIIYSWHN